MQPVSISDIEKKYELELEKIVRTIKKEKARKVLLQFPDGLKPYSGVIVKEIEKRTKAECLVWMGSCYGACDVPIQTEKLGVDLIVQFGHSNWKFMQQ